MTRYDWKSWVIRKTYVIDNARLVFKCKISPSPSLTKTRDYVEYFHSLRSPDLSLIKLKTYRFFKIIEPDHNIQFHTSALSRNNAPIVRHACKAAGLIYWEQICIYLKGGVQGCTSWIQCHEGTFTSMWLLKVADWSPLYTYITSLLITPECNIFSFNYCCH